MPSTEVSPRTDDARRVVARWVHAEVARWNCVHAYLAPLADPDWVSLGLGSCHPAGTRWPSLTGRHNFSRMLMGTTTGAEYTLPDESVRANLPTGVSMSTTTFVRRLLLMVPTCPIMYFVPH